MKANSPISNNSVHVDADVRTVSIHVPDVTHCRFSSAISLKIGTTIHVFVTNKTITTSSSCMKTQDFEITREVRKLLEKGVRGEVL